jgi:hypothetical protein
MPWWRELASRCHAFSQKLMQHESAENALLQVAGHESQLLTYRNGACAVHSPPVYLNDKLSRAR